MTRPLHILWVFVPVDGRGTIRAALTSPVASYVRKEVGKRYDAACPENGWRIAYKNGWRIRKAEMRVAL